MEVRIISDPMKADTRRREIKTSSKREVTKISEIYVCLAVIMLISIMLLGGIYTNICAKNVQSQYRLEDLRKEKAKLEKERLSLRLEVNKLSSLERIEKIAEKELGMAHPANRYILDMRNHSVLQASLTDIAAADSGLDGSRE